MGYRVTPFFSWGAAESISVKPETKLFYGADDHRKLAGEAVAY